jgi:ATP-dependent DNA helicase DinG
MVSGQMSDSDGGIENFFLDDSPLARHLPGFSPRPEQLEMARRVAQAIASGRHLAVEAGAGTGKTLAYLVPALVSTRRVVIATGTRTLQDQLYHRDLPVLCGALGRPARVAQLKGRANYLCKYRLERSVAEAPRTGRLRADLARVRDWATRTVAGDIGELAGIGENSSVWPLVTSTAENCLGSRCPNAEDCHVMAARNLAAESDIVVVNHHLLLADMALRDEGFGRLLPGAEVVIVDEAHRFPETAQQLLDVTLSLRQVEELLRDAMTEASAAGIFDAALREAHRVLADQVAQAATTTSTTGEPMALNSASPTLPARLADLALGLEQLCIGLGIHAGRAPGLDRCGERATALADVAGRITQWQDGSDLCWVQGAGSGLTLHLTPLDTAAALGARLQAQSGTWIFTSATLAVGDDFSHFAQRLGVAPLDTCRIDSPFDYGRCARLYLPAGMPAPEHAEYTARVVAAIEPILRASRGRAFLLFTSRRALQQAAALLASLDHGHTLLVQGSASRSRLLDEFVRRDNAVLLGTATFWEGVDIRGPALVVVAIDRLPFASPGDPFLQASLERVRRAGGDPFRDYQLPQAVLTLRQGVGRLIRGYDDYGVVVICDPRLRARGYGKLFLASLPPMPIVQSCAEACDFLLGRERHT